jgi:predicted RNA binding protein YcfA (HicA-like mRNA interferase family)
VKRKDLEQWLRTNGFEEARGSSGHAVWRGHGLTLAVSAHVPTVSKGVVGQLRRKLREAGFERTF